MNSTNSQRPKLQKFLADAGLCSRRKGEEWIMDGLVTINGIDAKLGERVTPNADIVKVNGKRVQVKNLPKITLLVNKPKGFVCSNEDGHADRLIFELLESKYRSIRLFCAGRLDLDSEGMVILTNDGSLAHRLTHPSHMVRKRYKVELDIPFDTSDLSALLSGAVIEEEFLKIDEVKPSKGKSLRSPKLDVYMGHGKKREIRRIFYHLGYKVKKLRRVAIGGLGIKNMSIGQSRLLKNEEIELLFPKEVS
ncbi:MAG: pseudouridine synthase [Opitutales bacterium]|nr:pseudouridine synthase [Opitutales bacterium]MDG1325021.1 pseudouridine synthase [Opitutales bacterium]